MDGVGHVQLLGAQFGCALVAGVAVLLLTSTLTIALCFTVFAFFGPVVILRRMRRRRQVALREVWPEAVDNLASAVRAGMSLPEGLSGLGERGPLELRAPFARFGAAYRASGRFGECLDALKDDLADPVGDRICETVRVAREVGGSDLGTVLRTLSELLRSDARTRSELETRQGWIVNAARLAVAAPWLVLLLLGTQSRTLQAYDSPSGTLLLADRRGRLLRRVPDHAAHRAAADRTSGCFVRRCVRRDRVAARRRARRDARSGRAARGALGSAAASRPARRPHRAVPRRHAPSVQPAGPAVGDRERRSPSPGGCSARRSADVVGLLDRAVGGGPSVRRRLAGLRSRLTVEEFRIEQVVWGAVGMLAGGVLRGARRPRTRARRAGARRRGRARRARRRHARSRLVADPPARPPRGRDARRVPCRRRPARARCGRRRGPAGRAGPGVPADRRRTRPRSSWALARSRTGVPLTAALSEVADQTTLEPFARFVQGIVVGIERGTPLADVLRAQAVDVRELGKRALLEAGGRKEISMMVPVVFLVLPVTVLFALYPGLITLTSLAR